MAAAAAAATAFGALSAGLAYYTVHGRRQTLDEAMQWQKSHYDLSWLQITPEPYTVTAADGYELHVQRWCRGGDPQRYVILSHGYTDNRYGCLKYMKMYLDLGWACITYDLRGHGENAPATCTYSLRESEDLACVIEDTRRRWGTSIRLGLHGESLGAATSVRVLGLRQDLDFVVADCGFSQIVPVLESGLEQMKLPRWLVRPASLAARLMYGYAFTDMRPVDSLSGNQVPILFIHGADDAFIPPWHSEVMHSATAGESVLHLIEGAGHAESVLKAPGLYQSYVQEFLETYAPEDGD